MTATRERPSAPTPDDGAADWASRSAFRTVRGKAWWTAVALSALPTAIGILADILLWSVPGILFTACYFVGSVLGVLLVRRRSLFGPMVTPPLVLAITMPIMMLVAGPGVPEGGGMTSTVLAVASPLINGFPAMAATTLATLAIGLVRMFFLERKTVTDADARPRKEPRQASGSERTTKQRKAARQRGREGAARQRDGEPDRKRATTARPPRDEQGRPARGERPKDGNPPPKDARPKRGGPPPGDGGPPPRDGGPPPGRGPSPGRGRPTGERNQPPGRSGPMPGRGRPDGPKPDRGSVPPPGRGVPPRPAPGRGAPPPPERRPTGEPPRRPRPPRREPG